MNTGIVRWIPANKEKKMNTFGVIGYASASVRKSLWKPWHNTPNKEPGSYSQHSNIRAPSEVLHFTFIHISFFAFWLLNGTAFCLPLSSNMHWSHGQNQINCKQTILFRSTNLYLVVYFIAWYSCLCMSIVFVCADTNDKYEFKYYT